MKPFSYQVVRAVDQASAAGARPGAAFFAGGTTLLDLMKLEVLAPDLLVDINDLPLSTVSHGAAGLSLGALVRMSDAAAHPEVAGRYPVIAEALLESASPQLRNMASLGGNLLQRTRCGYFRDTASACNRRQPGSGCAALTGVHRGHAILGGSERCVATHASDLAVALVALEARVRLSGPQGARTVALGDFYLLPGETPEREHDLRPGELIQAIEVPPLPWARRSRYLKVRDRASYEFALVSAAVALDLDGGTVRAARVAAGGVGTKPWRLPAVEAALVGAHADRESFTAAAAKAGDGAKPLPHNAFKVELLKRTLVQALLETARKEA